MKLNIEGMALESSFEGYLVDWSEVERVDVYTKAVDYYFKDNDPAEKKVTLFVDSKTGNVLEMFVTELEDDGLIALDDR